MNFLKDNVGAIMADAIQYYQDRERWLKEGYSQPVEAHNQFNLYIREFLAENPELTREEANTCCGKVSYEQKNRSVIPGNRSDLGYDMVSDKDVFRRCCP